MGNSIELLEVDSLLADPEIVALYDRYVTLLAAETEHAFPRQSLLEFIYRIAQSDLKGCEFRASVVSVLSAWIWQVENKPGKEFAASIQIPALNT